MPLANARSIAAPIFVESGTNSPPDIVVALGSVDIPVLGTPRVVALAESLVYSRSNNQQTNSFDRSWGSRL